MILVILFAAIAMALFLYLEYNDFGITLSSILVSIFPGIGGALVGFLVALCLNMKYETDTWRVKLVSLQDGNSTKGSFFLGTGQFNGVMKYVFYTEDRPDEYRMWQVDYYEAVVKYTEGTPEEIITVKQPTKALWNKFAIDLNTKEYSFVFLVPKGSIKSNYSLDAQ